MTNRSYNYSSIDTAYRCLRKYKYQYLDKLSTGMPESADMHFGTGIHAGVQGILEGIDGHDVFKLFWDLEKDAGLAYGRLSWDQLYEMGLEFLVRFERLHAKNFVPHTIEKRLYSTLSETIKVEGTADFIGHYKGKMSLVDFKTSGFAYLPTKLETSEQMYLYAYLAEQELGVHIEQLVYMVFVKQVIKGELSPRIQVLSLDLKRDKLKSMLDNVADMALDLDTRHVFPMNRNSCIMGDRKCDFWGKCYGTAERLDGSK